MFNILDNINKKYYIIGFLLLVFLVAVAFIDKALAIGILLIIFLTAITFLILVKTGFKTKTPYVLFLAVLVIHLVATCFLYYSHFQPFSGGLIDSTTYHHEAVAVSNHFREGNFSLKGLSFTTYFSIPIGIIYALTLPQILIGDSFIVWWAAICILFVFLIVKELGGSDRGAFITGIIATIYPSYIFYCSFLLKDTIIVPLAIIGLFIIIRLAKKFNWYGFLILYILMGAEVHLRIYVGYTLLITFLISFALIFNLSLKKKIIYLIIILPLVGFLPQISGYGYYGSDFLKQYLDPKIVTYYRDVVYNPTANTSQPAPVLKNPTDIVGDSGSATPINGTPLADDDSLLAPSSPSTGYDSSFSTIIKFENPILNFFGGTAESFVYVLLGPFPWQMKYARHFFALAETIPWYFLFYFIIKGILVSIKKRDKSALPLLLFSIAVMAILAVFITNFGIITRIRIPAFIALLCFLPLGFKDINLKKFSIIKK